MFFRGNRADAHRGSADAHLAGTVTGWDPYTLITTAGPAFTTASVTPVAGATVGIELVSAGFGGVTGGSATGTGVEWLTLPLAADVTISGAITGNLWAHETDMNANCAANFVVDKLNGATGAITQIVKSARTTEVALTTSAVNNFTATPASGVACSRGDRLRARVFFDDAGTMGAVGVAVFSFDGQTGGATGDSFLSFSETFTFDTAPAGTQLFLTDTASDVNPGAPVEKVAWTSRGAGSVNAITNTAAGQTTGIQTTNTAGGTAIEWFTRQLSAVSLGGICQFNVRALESNTSANASLRCEVAVTDSDGTSPTVIGSICIAAQGALTTSDAAYIAAVGVDDTAVTDAQRLRFRVYLDDTAIATLATGQTVTVTYGAGSAAVAGDTYVTLPASVTEFVVTQSMPPVPPFRQTSNLYSR